jgi:hypothetical protein
MPENNAKKKSDINRRQFIIKSAIGVCGLTAAYGTYNIAFSSTSKMPMSWPEALNAKPAIPPYNPEALYFKKQQYAMVATLAALIMPSDDEPGATEAGVVDYIDELSASSEKKQKLYTNGLNWLDSFCQKKYDRPFLNLSLKDQMELLSLAYDRRPANTLFQRVGRKVLSIWDGIANTRMNRPFLREVHQDVLDGFYSNPVSWQQVGYFGPPHPVGYMDFSEPPSSAHYIDTVRMVDNLACNTCHEKGEHPRGGFIDHTCTTCHRPHQPWPYDKASFRLEDHVGVVFSNPDRKREF